MITASSLPSLLALILAGAGFGAASISAWFWYRSAKIEVVPLWLKFGQIEPVDQTQSQSSWIVGILEAAQKSAAINRKAALWTGAAIVLAALSALVGAFAP